MTYLRELIDRLGKALGFTSRPRAGSEPTPAPPTGLADEGAPETEA